MKLSTLCVILKDDEILLTLKKKGFGLGKWNAVGGKVEKNESAKAAAIRETEEEVGLKIDPKYAERFAILDFKWKSKPEWDQQVHVFIAKKWKGQPSESEEVKPEWFKLKDIPYEKCGKMTHIGYRGF